MCASRPCRRSYGESVVMRLLSQSTTLLSLERLGMPAATEKRFRRLIERTSGLVLVTGPTGSGKTTTLYAALNHINRPASRSSRPRIPWNIGSIASRRCRCCRRSASTSPCAAHGAAPGSGHSPDRRDARPGTVEIGLRGAMTGHLVFSTLHTINAIASVNRLLDMGAPGYMIAAAVHGVVAQRLVRRVCTDCAAPAEPSANELAWLVACRPGINPADHRFVAGAGCTYCNLTGFRGRVASMRFSRSTGRLRMRCAAATSRASPAARARARAMCRSRKARSTSRSAASPRSARPWRSAAARGIRRARPYARRARGARGLHRRALLEQRA